MDDSSPPGGPPPKTLRSALRKAAVDRRQGRQRESKRALQVLGGVLMASGGSCLTFAHPDVVLAAMRDLDVVGLALVATGTAVVMAPAIRDAFQAHTAYRRQLQSLHMQLASTQKAVDALANELAITQQEPHLAQEHRPPQQYYAPSRVLHIRGVQADMSNDVIQDLYTLFSELGADPEKIIPVGHARSQALVQLSSIDLASAILEKFHGGIVFHSRLIFASFSMWPELQHSHLPPSSSK